MEDASIVAAAAAPVKTMVNPFCRFPSRHARWSNLTPIFRFNEGIQVWKSSDLSHWTELRFVWKYGDSPWHKPYLEQQKPLWAPEIHYLRNTF